MSKHIVVSDVVAKALELSAKSADEVLREAFKIKPEGLTLDGVTLPEGCGLIAWYKDRAYYGKIENGAIVVRDERFTSVSAAAGKITRRPTNGWDFWQVKLPGKTEFVPISRLRPKAAVRNAHAVPA